MPAVLDPIQALPEGAGRTAAARFLRRVATAVGKAAKAEQKHDRTRVRARGDCSRSFFDDPDRFAIALMMAIREPHGSELLRFGVGGSNWAAARHAAALLAPGRGQRVRYTFRVRGGRVRAQPEFVVGRERHDAAARRLHGKHRSLNGLPLTWCTVSALVLKLVNSTIQGAGRRHAYACLSILGWRDAAGPAFAGLDKLLISSKEFKRLSGLSANDAPRPSVDDRKRPPATGGARISSSMTTAASPVLLSIPATAERLGCGRTKVRDLMKAGELDAVKLGRRTLVTAVSIERLAERLPRV